MAFPEFQLRLESASPQAKLFLEGGSPELPGSGGRVVIGPSINSSMWGALHWGGGG